MKTVYLCGPINGCNDAECKDWREGAKGLLQDHCQILDPMARDYRGQEDMAWKLIVEGDREDIDGADLLLVNAPKASWGTAMEVFYAYNTGKKVVMMVPADGSISPWQRYHAHHIVHSLKEAIERVVRELDS